MLSDTKNKFFAGLSAESRFDGRYLLVVILIIYFTVVFFAGKAFDRDYAAVWRCIGVPVAEQPFIDVIMLTSALDCYRSGISASEIIVRNPCDPLQRPLNNPRLWLALAPLGIGAEHTLLFGIMQDIFFFIALFAFIKRLNLSESVLYGLLICSPSIMFAVERGNNDSILFIMLVLAAAMLRTPSGMLNSAAKAMILLGSFLKFYPIFSLIVFIKENKKTYILTMAWMISVFLLYCLLIKDDMIAIFRVTPREYLFSYGAFVYLDGLIKNLYPSGAAAILPSVHMLLQGIAGLVMICCLVLARKLPLSKQISTDHIDGFRIGAGIYTGTFLLGNNIEYRLIFLILTVPQLLAWAKASSTFRAISIATLFLFIIRCWGSVWGDIITAFPLRYTYFAKNFTEWLIFGLLIYNLIQTMPLWIKEKLHFKTA